MQDTSGPSDFASEAATPSSQQGDPLAGSGNSGSLHSQKSGGLLFCDLLFALFVRFLVVHVQVGVWDVSVSSLGIEAKLALSIRVFDLAQQTC